MYLAGLDIGGTKTAALIAKIEKTNLECICRKEIKTKRDWKCNLEELSEWILLQKKERNIEINYAGISCGGPLDKGRKYILSPPNLPGWDTVPVVQYMEDKLGVRAYLENDADACALAEYIYGAGIGSENMIFLTFGTGLGAGLILNGKLYRGSSGMAGEIGHIRMSENGPVGYYKEGSLEGYASGGGISALAKLEGLSVVKDGVRKDNFSAKEVILLARKGNAKAREIIEISAKYLGRGISILVDLLNPDSIVLGSIFSRAEDLFRQGIEKELYKEALPGACRSLQIKAAKLHEEIGDYGAICAALYNLQKENMERENLCEKY